MPDITMCRGTGCILRDRCYRYTAPPTPKRQAYFSKSPVRWEGAGVQCDYFWSDCEWVQVADSDDGARRFKCIHHGEYKSE